MLVILLLWTRGFRGNDENDSLTVRSDIRSLFSSAAFFPSHPVLFPAGLLPEEAFSSYLFTACIHSQPLWPQKPALLNPSFLTQYHSSIQIL